MTPPDAEDPALTGDFRDIWAGHIAANDAKPIETEDSSETPATRLKRRCKEALKPLADLGSRPLWEPRVTAGQVRFGGGKKAYGVGNKGQRDVLVTWFGHAFHFELKAGRDRMRDSQIRYSDFVRRSHGTDAEIREPRQMVAVMVRWYETHPATVAEAKRDEAALRGRE